MQKQLLHIISWIPPSRLLHKMIGSLPFTHLLSSFTIHDSRFTFHKHTVYRILLTAYCLLFTAASSIAQQAVFIPPSGKVFAHPGDPVGIFGNMMNEGNFGSAPGSVINFLGRNWENSLAALLPGKTGMPETPGGLFRFMGTQAQKLAAGFNLNNKTGPSFPNLSVENKSGVWLQDLNDLDIRGNLNFDKGYLYLNGWNVLVDKNITGYSDKGFVVTGGGIGGGSLYRKPPDNDTLLVFPVGTAQDSYSPYAMQTAEPFSGIVGATVFDHVYPNATAGNVLDSDYVKKTWQVTLGEGAPQTMVLLQHQEADEGIRFSPYRDSSYVSLYQVDNGAWDMDPLQREVLNPGMLTTGRQRNNTYINSRLFPEGLPDQQTGQTGWDDVNWLTISTAAYSHIVCPVADFKLWVAQRYNYKWVQLFWRTLRELNVMKYEVQRKLDTSENFITIATMPAKNVNGFSNHLLYYYYADSALYDGAVTYRLKMTSASGCVVYTNIQKISWGANVLVWPNPSPGPTHIKVLGIKHNIIMEVVNNWGQILSNYTRTVPPNIDYSIDLSGLADDVYYLVFRDPKRNNKKITVVKLVKITGR